MHMAIQIEPTDQEKLLPTEKYKKKNENPNSVCVLYYLLYCCGVDIFIIVFIDFAKPNRTFNE